MKNMSEASYVVGIEISRVYQEKYVEKVLKRSGMKNCKYLSTRICKYYILSKSM